MLSAVDVFAVRAAAISRGVHSVENMMIRNLSFPLLLSPIEL